MEDKLPVCKHVYLKVLAAESINLCSVVGAIDLAAGAGTWAKTAIDADIHYFGMSLTLKRQEELSNAQLGTKSPLFARGLAGGPPSLARNPLARPRRRSRARSRRSPRSRRRSMARRPRRMTESSESDSSSSPAAAD